MSRRRSHFFHSLARLTRAGVPVEKAGEIIERHARHDAEAKMLLSLRDGLQRGESIAGSLRPSLTAVEYGMVSAAESGGRLSEGFAQLEKYYAAVAEAQRKMRTALVYPLVLLNFAACASAVPTVMAGGNGLPVIAQALGILWLALAALWFGARALCRLAATSTLADGFLSRLPIAGKAWKLFALARWSAVMHFHIVSAQRMSAALDAAGAASGSASLAAATAQLSAAASAGQSVADEMPRHRVFPSLFCAGFATAEASGTLDEETRQQMQHCLEDATSAATALAEWLPRLFYAIVVLYVVWQIYRIVGGIAGTYERALDGNF